LEGKMPTNTQVSNLKPKNVTEKKSKAATPSSANETSMKLDANVNQAVALNTRARAGSSSIHTEVSSQPVSVAKNSTPQTEEFDRKKENDKTNREDDHNQNNRNDWTLVRHKRQKTGNNNNNGALTPNEQKINRPEPIKGTNSEVNELQVAERMHWVFVTGLSNGTEAQDVLNFLKNHQLDKGCVCEKMNTRSKVASSFKLGIPKLIKDDILDLQLWPTGVSVNHFLNLQRRPVTKTIPGRKH